MFKKFKTRITKSFKKPVFIALLELGEEKGLNGISESEIVEWALNNGFINSSYQKKHLFRLADEAFERPSPQTFILRTAYFYRLIEYRELQEARRNALWASVLSITAICISLFAIFSSIELDAETIESIGKSVAENVRFTK